MTNIIKKEIELTEFSCTRKEVDIEVLRKLQSDLHKRPDISEIADVFSTIGNEIRLKILFLLSKAGELCVCDISDILGQSVSAISHQLKKLKDNGFVKTRDDRPIIYYSISDNSFVNILVNFVKMGNLNVQNQHS